MGLRAAGVLVGRKIDEDPTTWLRSAGLPLDEHAPGVDCAVEDILGSQDELVGVALWRGSTLIACWELAEAVVTDPRGERAKRLIEAVRGPIVLVYMLSSVTSDWAFAFFEDGELRRWRSGTGGRVNEDFGAPLPQEDPCWIRANDPCADEREADWEEALIHDLFREMLGFRLEGCQTDEEAALEDEFSESPAIVFPWRPRTGFRG